MKIKVSNWRMLSKQEQLYILRKISQQPKLLAAR
ncbi:hypothetical protein J2Z58_003382 [Halobacillus andaensis]|nr:hypothetical protein [Halobacillus andaensis]